MRHTVQVKYNGVDVTQYTIGYEREKEICSSIGVARITLSYNAPITPELYKAFEIYEGGAKKGTYYVHTIDRTLPQGEIVFSCQDGSLKLQDYFISDNYFIDYPSNSLTWIEKFLTEAQVDYSLDGITTGSLLNNNTTLGMGTALEIIMPLLQQNGWYMSFDANNVAHIGKLTLDFGSYTATATDNQIINLEINNHDKMFRNRIVVWGQGDIRYELDKSGDFNNEYSGGYDVRTVVIANSNIATLQDAIDIANVAMREFSKADYEVTVDLAGVYSYDAGDSLFVDSNFGSLGGIITTYGTSMNSSGLTTHIVLNQRCPRLFAFYDFGTKAYVYVGMQGGGVWRKPLDEYEWESFNNGLSSKNVIDLAIDNGVYACVTDDGKLFIRNYNSGVWQEFNPGWMQDHYTTSGKYPPTSGMCTSVTIDKSTGKIIAPFTLKVEMVSGYIASGDPLSWIYYITNQNSYTSYQFHDDEDFASYRITSLDNNGYTNLVSTIANYSGQVWLWHDDNHPNAQPLNELNSTRYLTASGYLQRQGIVSPYGSWGPDTMTLGDGKYLYNITSYYNIGTNSTTISVYEVPTKEGLLGGNFLLSITGRVNLSLAKTIANRTVCIVYYDENDAMSFKEVNFRDSVIREFHSQYKFYCLSTAFDIIDGNRRLYTLCADFSNFTNMLYVIFYNPDYPVCVNEKAVSIAPSFYGGSLISVSEMEGFTSSVSGNFMFFPIMVYYTDVNFTDPVYGTYTDDARFPVVVIKSRRANWVTIHEYMGGILKAKVEGDIGYAGMLAFGTIKNYGYMLAYANEHQVVIRIDPELMYFGEIFDETNFGFNTAIGSKNRLYFLFDNGGESGGWTWFFDVIQERYVRSMLKNRYTALFCNQYDEEFNRVVYYDLSTHWVKTWTMPSGIVASGTPVASGTVIDYSLPSGVLDAWYPDVTPDLATVNGYLPKYYPKRSSFEMVYDSFVINLASETYLQNNGQYWYKMASRTVVPSGVRMCPVNYTRWEKNKASLYNGYKDQAYKESMKTYYRYTVESDQDSFIAFGGVVYSGLVFSGIQTGWNQSRLYLSQNGQKFSEVLLSDIMRTYVPDARTFSAVVDVESYVIASGTSPGISEVISSGTSREYRDYLVYPQIGSTIVDNASYTDLMLVDISDLSGVVVVSGTLGRGIAEATFPGWVNHVETTNYINDVPYIWVSISGLPPKIYQKDGYDVGDLRTYFYDVTSNLPEYKINCIRVDDQT